MKTFVARANWTLRCGVVLLLLALLPNAHALQINRTSSTNLFVDLLTFAGNYAAYQITNNDAVAYSNLWVTITNFSGTVIALGGGDSGRFNLGSLDVNQAKTVFFYLTATNATATETHAVRVYQGSPSVGSILVASNYSLTVKAISTTSQNKLNAIAYSPANPILGSILTITVDGVTGPLKTGDPMVFTPAAYTNWGAYAFQVVSTSVRVTNGIVYTFTNALSFGQPGGQSAVNYHVEYQLRAVAPTPASTQISPDGAFGTGNNSTLEHSTLNTGVTLPTILPPTNSTTLTNFASVHQLYTNQIVTYTVRFTNSGASSVTLDSIVDTLPSGFSYVAGSATFAGSVSPGPAISGQVLTWSAGYAIPAAGSVDFTFQAIPLANNYGTNAATNSVVAYSQSTVIDTTLATSDNAPGTAAVRVLLRPTAANDSYSSLEDATLTITAPGVLANDTEPNGFTMTVASYSSPTNGSLTLNSNGSFTYQPAANYYGSDSFTYTMTNGNAGASTATVSLTVAAVNDPPTLNALNNLTVNEDAGLQTVNLSGITAGPPNESAQTLTVTATSSNPSLIPNPAVAYTSPNATGSLSFTPVANQFGTATMTVVVQDSGGTANGGVDSVTNTFTVTVNPVNDAPSFTKGADQTVLEDAGAQTVANWASGISAGPANEASQTLTFVVANDNNSLFAAQPAVSSNGTLTYTPAANANGSATVTVYLQDNGGTANGGSDTSPTNTFTITVTAVNDPPTLNALTNLTLSANAGLQTVNLSGITAGPANEGAQTLTVTATSSNPALIPNPTVAYTSPNTTGSLTFTPATNQSGTATITVVVQDSGGTAGGGVDAVTNSFTVTVQALPPVADLMTVFRNGNVSLKIRLSDVAAHWSDPTGGQVFLTGVNLVTTNGIKLVALNWTTNSSGYIVPATSAYIGYANTNIVVDRILYSIANSLGQTNTGTIQIQSSPYVTGQGNPKLLFSAQSITATFYGLPGLVYQVQRSTNPADQNGWVTIATPTPGTNGTFAVEDTFSDLGAKPASAFYRLKWQP